MAASRWPLNVVMWKKNDGVLDPQKFDFYEVGSDFDKCRDLICAKLQKDGFEAGLIWADARDEAYEAKHGFMPQPERIELHYRAFDDPYRGRIVRGGMCSAKEADAEIAALKTQCEKKVFTPNELYDLRPIDAYNSPERLEKWMNEEAINIDCGVWKYIERTGLVKLKYLVNEYMGSDESFEIATVWYAGNPVAVVTHSGEDNSARYITDISGWYGMVAYLRSFMSEEEVKPTVVDPNMPLYWLTEPDGYHTLHDYYDVEKMKKKEVKL